MPDNNSNGMGVGRKGKVHEVRATRNQVTIGNQTVLEPGWGYLYGESTASVYSDPLLYIVVDQDVDESDVIDIEDAKIGTLLVEHNGTPLAIKVKVAIGIAS